MSYLTEITLSFYYVVNSVSSVHDIYSFICWEPTGSNQHYLSEKYLSSLKLNKVTLVITTTSFKAIYLKDNVKVYSTGTHSGLIWQSANSLSFMTCRLMLVREIIRFYCENHTRLINRLCDDKQTFFMLQQVLHVITTAI